MANPSSAQRRLADMGAQPEAEVYERPPEHECEVLQSPVPVDDEGRVRFYWVQWIHRGQVVHFSVEIHVRDHALADWSPTYRCDSSHGTVHEHRFWPDGREERAELADIPPDDGGDFVSGWFSRALIVCDDDLSQHVKRWMTW